MTHPSSPNSFLPRLLAAAIILTLVVTMTGRSHATASSAFSPGGYRVDREWITSTSLRVRMTREALPNIEPHQPYEQRFFAVAGVPGQTPSVTLRRSEFYRFSDGQLQDIVAGPPRPPDSTASIPVSVVSPLGRFRQFETYRVAVQCVIAVPVPQRQEVWQARYLEFDIELNQPQPSASSSTVVPFQQPGQLAKDFLLNPDVDPTFYQSTTPPSGLAEIRDWTAKLLAASTQGSVLRIRVTEPGLYQLDAVKLNLDPRTIADWRIYHLGKEIPILTDAAPGSTTPLFMAENFSRANFGYDVYWLIATPETAASPSQRVANNQSVTTEPLTSSSESSVVIYEERYEGRKDFHTLLRPDASTSQWVWASIRDGRNAAFELEMPAEIRDADARDVSLTVKFGYEFQPNLPPEIELLINGRAELRVTPQVSETQIRLPLLAEKLTNPTTQLAISVRYNKTLPQKPNVLIQHAILRWQSPVRIAGDSSLPFQLNPADAAKGVLNVANASVANGDVVPLMPYAQSGASLISPAVSGNNAIYKFATAGAGPYTFVNPATVRHPNVTQTAVKPPGFDDRSPVNYLVLTHGSLRTAANKIAAHRASQGWLVHVADVDEIFDSYGFGRRDPNALRLYMQHLLTSRHEPKLSHVLLLGEASADKFLGDDPTSSSIPADMVPVCVDMETEKPRGDYPYSCLLGSDNVADVALGRVSVRTPEEALAAIDKIIAYDSNPMDAWALKTEFVTDDNDEFPLVADDIIARASSPSFRNEHFRQSDLPYEVNVRVNGRLRAREGTDRLVKVFNEGRGMLNFFGHGGPNLWSHERLLHLSDLKLLHNEQRLPFITCSSCDNAWLDYPLAPADVSISELFVKKPGGGAIAMFGPVAGASPFEHQILMRRVVEGVHQRGMREIGGVTLFGLNSYVLDTSSSNLSEQYVLLGDPATRLRMPIPQSDLVVTPDVVIAGKPALLQLGASLGDGAGTATLSVRSARTGEVVTESLVRQVSGRLSTELAIPALERGTYAVVVEHDDGRSIRVSTGRLNSDVARLAITVNPETTGPLVWGPGPVNENVQVTNLSALNLRTVSLARTYSTDGRMPTTDSLGHFRNVEGFSHRSVRVQREPLIDSSTIYLARAREQNATARAESFLFRPMQYPTPAVITPIGAKKRNVITVQPYPALIPLTITNMTTQPLIGCSLQAFDSGGDITDLSAVGDIPIGGKKTVVSQVRVPMRTGETAVSLKVTGQIGGELRSTLLAQRDVVLSVTSEADLEIVPGSVRVESPSGGPLTTLRTVLIHALVTNKGAAPLTQIPLTVRFGMTDDAPVAESINDMQNVSIPRVAPGETVPVEFRWERNTTAGPVEAYLVVNGQRTLRESDYAKNIAKIPPVEIAKAENLVAVDALLVESQTSASLPTTSATLIGNFRNDGTRPFARVQLEFGTRNAATGDSNSTITEVTNIVPGETRSIHMPLSLTTSSVVAFATINSNREELEVTTTDNTLEVPIERVVIASDMLSGPARALPVAAMQTSNLQAIGATYLRQAEEPTSVSIFTPFMPEFVTTGTYVRPKAEPAEEQDNMWTINPWYIGASARENPGDLMLMLPAGNLPDGVPCDLYVSMATGTSPAGESFGAIRYQMEGSTTETVGAFDGNAGNFSTPRVKWGTFAPRNGHLRVRITKPAGKAARLVSYEVIPRSALATSPILDFAEDTSAPINATIDTVTKSGKNAPRLVGWTANEPEKLLARNRTTPGLPPAELAPGRFAIFEIDIPYDDDSRVTLQSVRFPTAP